METKKILIILGVIVVAILVGVGLAYSMVDSNDSEVVNTTNVSVNETNSTNESTQIEEHIQNETQQSISSSEAPYGYGPSGVPIKVSYKTFNYPEGYMKVKVYTDGMGYFVEEIVEEGPYRPEEDSYRGRY